MSKRYNIYPSLLDRFENYLHIDYDKFFYQDEGGAWHINYTESGGYHYSPEEVDELAKKDLIDSINRVYKGSEAASKGTAFNECIDAMVMGKKNDNLVTTKVADPNGNIYAIEVEIDGYKFLFSLKLIKEVSERFKDCLCQQFTCAEIETKYGTVELYGYIDYLLRDMVIDLKTTKNYTFGNYRKYWQRLVYPYCLIESGDVTNISEFEFYIVELNGGTPRKPLIEGHIYNETYNYDHEKATADIREHCELFIEFLEQERDLITDKKIFNYESNH